jgi:hypothetical protein
MHLQLSLTFVSLLPPAQDSDPTAADVAKRGAQVNVSGIYRGLELFNDENECGLGAVVDWADRLWAITYAAPKPRD